YRVDHFGVVFDQPDAAGLRYRLEVRPKVIDLQDQLLIRTAGLGVEINIDHWPIEYRRIHRYRRCKIDYNVGMTKCVDPLEHIASILRSDAQLRSRVRSALQNDARSKPSKKISHLEFVVDRMRPHYHLYIAQLSRGYSARKPDRAVTLLQKIR